MQLGSTPATAEATTRAIGVSPSSVRMAPLVTDSAAAPSLMPLDVAAVTVPCDTNAGSSRASAFGSKPGAGRLVLR